MNLSPERALILAVCVVGLTASHTPAAVISQTYIGSFPANIVGSLPDQSSVLEEAITLSSITNLTAFTTSYASGGFQPNLFLFNPAGVAIAASSGQKPPNAAADPVPGTALDAYLFTSSLIPGTYTLALTDFNLNQAATATNLTDGFTTNYGNGATFVDVNGVTRSGNYALTIDAAATAATPEPSTAFLISLGLLTAFLPIMRWRSSTSDSSRQQSQ